jgi:hypothetical protein
MGLQSVIHAMNIHSNSKARLESADVKKEYVGRKPKKKRKKALYLAKLLNK